MRHTNKAGAMAGAYYNEIDPYAAQWLRNLIAKGHIAAGEVDERSIEDVRPGDLRGFTQCHFFAGIGVWSYALRLAGWPDDRPVWTGSCPCQPFSAAGKGAGFADERHLWPAWAWLIGECRPPVILGEQVASKDIDPWIDLVQADLEAMGYALGCVPFPSAGVGAPHIRDRAYFMAHADNTRSQGRKRVRQRATECATRSGGVVGIVADAECGAAERQRFDMGSAASGMRSSPREQRLRDDAGHGGDAGQLEHASSVGRERRQAATPRYDHDGAAPERPQSEYGIGLASAHRVPEDTAGPTNGFWRVADWLLCRDEKWRPVEPGYEQMADGSATSLGRVRADDVEKITEEINAWSTRHQTDAGEALRRVWADLQSQALCEREVGRFSGVQSPAVLLAFLRQLTDQGWRLAVSLPCASAEASSRIVRVMQFDADAARTPLRRELAEQLAGQLADPVRELSSIVAHHAARCWGEACRAKAGAASFPLMEHAPARVGRLRAYGNAINAQAAAEFIRASREAIEL